MKSLLFGALLFSATAALAQSCPEGQIWNSCSGTSVGPAPCIPGCVVDTRPESIGPGELCIRDDCRPVEYVWRGDLLLAQSTLPNGYAVMGWAGPCLYVDRGQCPDIANQAFEDLRLHALRANRAQEALTKTGR